MWNPIETAPEGRIVVVGWLDLEDTENPERYDFDCKEEGGWLRHAEHYEHYCMVASEGMTGPKREAPYTHWLEVPPLMTANIVYPSK